MLDQQNSVLYGIVEIGGLGLHVFTEKPTAYDFSS